ncbi:hypothetical protein [Diaphorobacter aerolatus]|uniref:hypothetical protein n=1 Tax=Diaphorobacter aerolatus TaxID=1288495 RepID=UPI00299F6744|nr:hypothetical protein [Diaphorobacter aerolatus]
MRSSIRPFAQMFNGVIVGVAVLALVGCSTARTDRGEVKGMVPRSASGFSRT